jgi:hypothetical protein
MHLPGGFEDLLFGAQGTPEAQKFVTKNYKRIQSEIFTKWFGEGSFIQKFILGRLSTTGDAVSLHCCYEYNYKNVVLMNTV